MKLLLVDSSFNRMNLLELRKDNVDYITFNFRTDTYASLAEKIITKNVEFTDIALIQYLARRFRILRSEPILNSLDPSSLEGFSNFISLLKERVGLRHFDMLAAVYNNRPVCDILSRLEAETGVDFRTSTNFNGNYRELPANRIFVRGLKYFNTNYGALARTDVLPSNTDTEDKPDSSM
jgi:hypothetical protein